MQPATAAPITAEEWSWVQALIHEVHHEERREEFARELFQWELAIRKFRQVEERLLLRAAPTPGDLNNHAACLHGLLAIGHRLVIAAATFSPEALASIGTNRDRIPATVEALELSLREWHHGYSAAVLDQAQETLFGAPA